MVKKISVILLLLCCSITYAKLTASVDRETIQENESFSLIVEKEGLTKEQPDFNVLRKDFQVGGVSSGTSMSMVNGKSTYSLRQWKIMLIPNRVGKIEIPSFTVDNEKTAPIVINVTKEKVAATQSKDVFFESTLSTQAPFIHQQVYYRLRFYFRHPFVDSQSSLALPTFNGKEMKLVNEPKRFLSSKNGVNYQVYEFNFTIIPDHSGDVSITAPRFRGIMLVNDSGDLTYDAFAHNQEKQVIVSGEGYQLKVKPIPSEFTGKWWLPAKSVSLTESWSKPLASAKIGEQITRKITLRAVGVVGNQLPDLSFAEIDGLNIYPDKPQADTTVENGNMVATKKFTVAYVPTLGNKYDIPSISIPWWDTTTNTLKTATLAAQTLVAQGAAPTTAVEQKEASVSDPAVTIQENKKTTHWPTWGVVVILMISGWVFGATAIYRTRRRVSPSTKFPERNIHEVLPYKKALKLLKQACEQKNTEQAYRYAIETAQSFWPNKTILNLSDILLFANNPDLSRHIDELNNYRYANHDNQSWNGMAFYDCFSKVIGGASKKSKSKEKGLPELYTN